MDPCIGDEDEDGEHMAISCIGEGLMGVPTSVAAFSKLKILCLHGNSIRRIEHLSKLTFLEELNLSSNCIEAIEELTGLTRLTSLNLASNCLKAISGLEGLCSLKLLTLSHNNISSLKGLGGLQGCSLEMFDIRNNAIDALHEFSVLASYPNLAELFVEGGKPGNPVCLQPSYRPAVISALPQLQKLDSQVVNTAEAMQYLASLHLQAFQPLQMLNLEEGNDTCGGHVENSSVQCCGPDNTRNTESPQLSPSQVVFQQQMHSPTADKFNYPVLWEPAQCNSTSPRGHHIQTNSKMLTSSRVLPAKVQRTNPETRNVSAALELCRLLEDCPQLTIAIGKALNSSVDHASDLFPVCSAINEQDLQDVKCSTNEQLCGGLVAKAEKLDCSVQTEMHSHLMADLQLQVEQLQEEVEALNAELEVQSQNALAASQRAATALQQAKSSAEKQVFEVQKKVDEVVQQAKLEVANSQEHSKLLEEAVNKAELLSESHLKRQRDLECELGRAWEELERAEAALQMQHAAHDTSMQQMESKLLQSEQCSRYTQEELKEVIRMRDAFQRDFAEQQALAARLRTELDFVEKSRDSRATDLQKQLEVAQQQVLQLTQELKELQACDIDAREQLKQLSSSLGSVHEEHEAAICELNKQHEHETKSIVAEKKLAIKAALEERDTMQRRLTTTEAEFRCALQEAARETSEMRRDLELLAADGINLRQALDEEHRKRKEAEGMVSELTDVVQHQKLRMRGLAQEKAEIGARLAAMNPQELDRVRGELLTLRERAGELGAIRDQLTQERRLSESLQQRLVAAQQQLVDAREDAARKVATADVAARSAQDDAAKKAAAADTAAAEANYKAEQLGEEVSRLRDAVKVKEAMLDSANEQITELKNTANAAQAAADEARLIAEEAEEELRAREGSESDKQHNLRAEIEAQEQIIERLERRVRELESTVKAAEKRVASAEASALEKENVINYVGEEVERVKGMFEQKETRLTQERDAARKTASQLKSEHDTLSAMVQQLELSVQDLSSQLHTAQAKVTSSAQEAAKRKAEAQQSAARVVEVEEELREVLGVLEQHKATSAAKFKQLQNVLQDLQPPLLQF